MDVQFVVAMVRQVIPIRQRSVVNRHSGRRRHAYFATVAIRLQLWCRDRLPIARVGA
jgi:hypothetical protein